MAWIAQDNKAENKDIGDSLNQTEEKWRRWKSVKQK